MQPTIRLIFRSVALSLPVTPRRRENGLRRVRAGWSVWCTRRIDLNQLCTHLMPTHCPALGNRVPAVTNRAGNAEGRGWLPAPSRTCRESSSRWTGVRVTGRSSTIGRRPADVGRKLRARRVGVGGPDFNCCRRAPGAQPGTACGAGGSFLLSDIRWPGARSSDRQPCADGMPSAPWTTCRRCSQ